MPSSLRRDVFFFSAANFLQVTTYLTTLVTYPRFLTVECGLGEMRAGALVGLLAISNFLAVLPIGLLSDRISPKRLLQFCQLSIVVFTGLLTVTRSEWALWLLFIFGGMAFSGARSLLPVLYYKYLPEEKRSTNVSLFLGIGFFGFGVGGQLSGFAQAQSALLPFYIAAGTATALALWTQFLPDSKPEKIRIFEYIGDLFHVKVLPVLAIFVLMGLHFGVEQYGFPKLITDGLHIGARTMGIIYLIIGVLLGGTVVMLRSFLEDRPKHYAYFGVGLVISGFFHAFTYLATDITSLLIIRLLHVIGDGMIIMMMGVVVAGIFPGARMGGNVGFTNLVNTVGQFAGAFMAGLCIENLTGAMGTPLSTYGGAFTISGAIATVCGVAFLVFRRRLGIAEREQSSPQ